MIWKILYYPTTPLPPPRPSCSPISHGPTLALVAFISPKAGERGKTNHFLKVHEKKKEKGRTIRSEEEECTEVLPVSVPGDLGFLPCSFFKAEDGK